MQKIIKNDIVNNHNINNTQSFSDAISKIINIVKKLFSWLVHSIMNIFAPNRINQNILLIDQNKLQPNQNISQADPTILQLNPTKPQIDPNELQIGQNELQIDPNALQVNLQMPSEINADYNEIDMIVNNDCLTARDDNAQIDGSELKDLAATARTRELQQSAIKNAIFKSTLNSNQYNFNGKNTGINSCGPMAISMITDCLLNGNFFNIKDALQKGFDKHIEINSANIMLNIDDVKKFYSNGIKNEICFELASNAEQVYEENLNKIVSDDKIGVLFLKNNKYHGIIVEKNNGATHVTITDSHGDYKGQAFAYTFKNVKDGAKFLATLSPYHDSKQNLLANTCSFCILNSDKIN